MYCLLLLFVTKFADYRSAAFAKIKISALVKIIVIEWLKVVISVHPASFKSLLSLIWLVVEPLLLILPYRSILVTNQASHEVLLWPVSVHQALRLSLSLISIVIDSFSLPCFVLLIKLLDLLTHILLVSIVIIFNLLRAQRIWISDFVFKRCNLWLEVWIVYISFHF